MDGVLRYYNGSIISTESDLIRQINNDISEKRLRYVEDIKIMKDNISDIVLLDKIRSERNVCCYVSACKRSLGYIIYEPVMDEVYGTDYINSKDFIEAKSKAINRGSSCVIYLPSHEEKYFRNLKESKEYAFRSIWNFRDAAFGGIIYVIDTITNKAYTVHINATPVWFTFKKSIKGKRMVEPIYNWNYALVSYDG